MDNYFIAQYFGWRATKPSARVDFVNRLLEKAGLWVRLTAPVARGMTNTEQRINIYHLINQVLAYSVPGDVVEVGCNEGQTAVILQEAIELIDPLRHLHVYDSFEGLPDISEADGSTSFRGGQLSSTEAILIENFQTHKLKLPHIHKGWFEDTLPSGLPDQICFAHLDGDLYSSIKSSLENVYPKLSTGAICLIDDYADPAIHDGWNDLPGVKAACDEFLADKPENVFQLYAGNYPHGFFRKS